MQNYTKPYEKASECILLKYEKNCSRHIEITHRLKETGENAWIQPKDNNTTVKNT